MHACVYVYVCILYRYPHRCNTIYSIDILTDSTAIQQQRPWRAHPHLKSWPSLTE